MVFKKKVSKKSKAKHGKRKPARRVTKRNRRVYESQPEEQVNEEPHPEIGGFVDIEEPPPNPPQPVAIRRTRRNPHAASAGIRRHGVSSDQMAKILRGRRIKEIWREKVRRGQDVIRRAPHKRLDLRAGSKIVKWRKHFGDYMKGTRLSRDLKALRLRSNL